jgi:hypothetical protein
MTTSLRKPADGPADWRAVAHRHLPLNDFEDIFRARLFAEGERLELHNSYSSSVVIKPHQPLTSLLIPELPVTLDQLPI